jgi:hypothetical protein
MMLDDCLFDLICTLHATRGAAAFGLLAHQPARPPAIDVLFLLIVGHKLDATRALKGRDYAGTFPFLAPVKCPPLS